MKRGASCTIDKQNGKSYEWKLSSSPRSKKIRVVRGKGKVMLEVFFYGQDIGYFEFIPEGKVVSIVMLCRFGDEVRRKRPKNGEPTFNFSFTTMLQHTG